jgi:hypothetical protein
MLFFKEAFASIYLRISSIKSDLLMSSFNYDETIFNNSEDLSMLALGFLKVGEGDMWLTFL